MSTKHVRLVLLLLATLATVTQFTPAQGGNQNPGVIPPDAGYRGLTYGEWSADWWKAFIATPIPDLSPSFEGQKGIVFLSAPLQLVGDPQTTIPVTVSQGTPLFIPVVTVECSVFEPPPFHGDDEDSLRACANQLVDGVTDVYAEIDGRAVNNLGQYRVDSPLFVWGPVPVDNILGAPEGTTSPAVADGYYLMLTPLSVGEHEVILRATIGDFGLEIDTKFVINVLPQGKL